MAQNTDATPAQIKNELVATALGQVGDQRDPYDDDAPAMRYFNIAANALHRNVERGLFIDGEDTDALAYGWTNDERSTWKVTDQGSRVVVTDVADLEVADADDPVADEQGYVQEWLEILLDELRYDVENGATRRSVRDEIEFVGSKMLRLRDGDGRMATFEIELED